MTALLRSAFSSALPALSKEQARRPGAGEWPQPRRAVQMVGPSGRAGGGFNEPGSRDPLWGGSFGSSACSFSSALPKCFQTASQALANIYDLSEDSG